ncbi:MAG TPA: DNA recombination protein RmuC [Candidatus Aminicenantes bacterium]|nr:DNA recombination protein RmuC [Candidatus Aminicenantes bacterium]HRY65396.1 DNA recombination protein RmuC [Candidatus Aminicenantes bacterium]HRZ72136.1 DNA recombination protein RmuC [Candidatus Aminicenantes bacterium]
MEILLFAGGAVFGALVVIVIHAMRKKDTREIARALVHETEAQKIQDLESLIGRVRDSFGALSQDALKASTGELLKLAKENLDGRVHLSERDLDSKKQLIDQNLAVMKGDIQKMQDLVQRFEKERAHQYGEVSNQLRNAADQTSRLQETADRLRAALASTKARGQWGERMAEDVLRLAGFIEGVNYIKQKVLDLAASRPDYTFWLPQGLKVNMDVKFPLNGYLRYLEADNDTARETSRAQFLRDVRTRIKEVTTRDYINPEEKTLDYVLVFIPNEQVYAFINENDPGIMDEALKAKVILCSPFTLFAILAIIRQSLDNFSMEKTAGEILGLVQNFKKEWERFGDCMAKMGEKLEGAASEYRKLTTTRQVKLDKSIQKIEDLQRLKGLEGEIPAVEAEAEPAELEAGEPKAR